MFGSLFAGSLVVNLTAYRIEHMASALRLTKSLPRCYFGQIEGGVAGQRVRGCRNRPHHSEFLAPLESLAVSERRSQGQRAVMLPQYLLTYAQPRSSRESPSQSVRASLTGGNRTERLAPDMARGSC